MIVMVVMVSVIEKKWKEKNHFAGLFSTENPTYTKISTRGFENLKRKLYFVLVFSVVDFTAEV